MLSTTRTFSKKAASVVGWTAIGNTGDWGVGALSDDGTKIILANKTQNPGPIEYSADSGNTFTNATAGTPRQAFTSLAMSAEGSAAYLVTAGSYIFKTTNGGASWSLNGTTANRQVIACDSTGTKVVTAIEASTLSTSVNSGDTWTVRTTPGTAGFNAFQCLGMSGNGLVIGYVSARGGSAKYFNCSGDGGATWPTQVNLTTTAGAFNSICMSENGSQMMMTFSTGQIWISSNTGGAWSQDSTAPTGGWLSCDMSSDGSVRVACNTNGNVYVKRGALAWAVETSLGNRAWRHVSCSSNGSKILAVSNGGRAYKNY